MKKLLLVIALAVCMVGVAKAELFSNPDFEDGFNNWSEWGSGSGGVGWRSSNFANVIQDGTAHSGDIYVEQGWSLSVGTTWGYSLVFQNPLVTPGETYVLSAWVRDGLSDPDNPGAGTIPARLTYEQRYWDGTGSRGDEVEDRVHVNFDIPSDGQWHFISTTHTCPLTVNQFTAICGMMEMGYTLDVDDMSLASNKAYDPQPADGDIVDIELDTLAWKNPAPNDADFPITCEVWFTSDFPEEGRFEDDPNFSNYAQSIQVNEDNISAIIPDPLEIGQTYFWRVDCTDPNTGEIFIGNVWRFATDNTAPDVDAGQDVNTWLTQGTTVVSLDATVTDDGFPTPAELTFSWAVIGGDAGSVDIAALADPQDPDTDVTLSAVGTYELELTANDGELDASDTVTIVVHDNACNATKADGVQLLVGDLNEDCIVDMGDVAIMADHWLSCISLDCL